MTGVSLLTPSWLEPARIEVDVDARQLGQAVHHFAERRVLVAQQHGRLQPALDFQLALGAALDAVLASPCDP